jgi:hypothetical protein
MLQELKEVDGVGGRGLIEAQAPGFALLEVP